MRFSAPHTGSQFENVTVTMSVNAKQVSGTRQTPCTQMETPTKVRSFGIATVVIGPGRPMNGLHDNRHGETPPQASEGGKLAGTAAGVPRKNPCNDPAPQVAMDRVRLVPIRLDPDKSTAVRPQPEPGNIVGSSNT